MAQTQFPGDEPDDDYNELGVLASVVARLVWQGKTADQVIEYIARHGAALAPEIAAGIDPRAGVPEFFRLLARAMWNAIPQPDHGFRLMKLPLPGRNDPCFCGSGRKYKQCCANLPEFPMEPSLMLETLLHVMPRKHWANLAHSQINRVWMIAVAYRWLRDGAAEQVLHLLEPWFKGEGTIRNEDGDLLDLLLDAYADLDKPRKRKTLAIAATQRGENYVRYLGWQRLALMELDAGNLAASHAALKEAMRADPDDPNLGPLEVTLLIGEGNTHMAQERARFWLAKMARLRDPELKDRMAWLQQVVENPEAAMFRSAANSDPALARLEELMQSAPPPACHYRLDPENDSTGPFEPEPALAKLISKWAEVFPAQKPFSVELSTYNAAPWQETEAWLHLLHQHPMLWQSFDVLDDLVIALDGYGMTGVAQMLVPPLLARAEQLFELVRVTHHAENMKSEWGWLQNRPALRLLVRLALDNERAQDAAAREQAFNLKMRLVTTINPNDNHGLRAGLVAELVRRGRAEDAIALAARYPDDLADMEYNRILALYAAHRLTDAEQAARNAFLTHPKVGYMLIAKTPRKPRLDPHGYRLGSEQEAWLYRDSFHAYWEAQSGALEWLQQVAHAL